MRAAVVLTLVLAFACACSNTKNASGGDSTQPVVGTATASVTAIASASASALPPSSSTGDASPPASSNQGSCKVDADCRTFSSYCNEMPCGCRALGANDPNPQCATPGQVKCLVNPCGRKTAACQSGRCELVIANANQK